MAQTYPDVLGENEWQDIAALPSHSEIAGQRVTIQAKDGTFNYVYFGGATPPDPKDGHILSALVAISGTADHFWVRGTCRFAVTVED